MVDWHTSKHRSEVRSMSSILSARPCEGKGRRERREKRLRHVYFAAVGRRGKAIGSARCMVPRLGGHHALCRSVSGSFFLGPSSSVPLSSVCGRRLADANHHRHSLCCNLLCWDLERDYRLNVQPNVLSAVHGVELSPATGSHGCA